MYIGLRFAFIIAIVAYHMKFLIFDDIFGADFFIIVFMMNFLRQFFSVDCDIQLCADTAAEISATSTTVHRTV